MSYLLNQPHLANPANHTAAIAQSILSTERADSKWRAQNDTHIYRHFLQLCLLCLAMISVPSFAVPVAPSISGDSPATTSTTGAEPNTTGVVATPVADIFIDPFGRQTPRSTVQGFITALADNDTGLAANYLDIDPSDNANDMVRHLNLALDVGGRLRADLQISNEVTGDLADKLPVDKELVGTVTVGDRTIDLMLVRKQAVHGNQYWQFSNETLQAIKQADFKHNTTLVDKYKVERLVGKSIYGYDLSQVLAVVLLALSCLIVVYAITGLGYGLLYFLYPRFRQKRLPIESNVVLPLSLVITSMVLSELMVYAGVSVTVRDPVIRIKDIVAWFALTWLLLRVIDAIFNRAENLSYRHHRPERVSILSLLRKVVKALLLILALIFIFGNLGFDLTTGIAALGVGGLALALGAQKMIENLVGSVVVVADQPVRVGDYCKFGELEGTVVDIGIRSTRVRTIDRTIVTVPNGDFSSMSIENFAQRDMFNFMHNIYIKRNVDANALEALIHGLQDFIETHEYSNMEWTQVRLAELRQDSFVIEMRCYIYCINIVEFYDKQTKLIVEILTEIEKYDVEHALPTQHLVIDSKEHQL